MMRITALLFLVALPLYFEHVLGFSRSYQATHSFSSPLNTRSSLVSPFWEASGNVVITDSYIRLTPAVNERRGALWNIEPAFMEAWEAEFEFKVSGDRSRGADGFSFWYVSDPGEWGPVFGYKDYFHGLGVMFDTFDNDENGNNPYISVMINDGTLVYDKKSDGLKSQIGGCVSRFRNTNAPVKARVTYSANTLSVEVDILGEGKYEMCTRVHNVQLPLGYHFGFTAETGGLADNHDILSLRTCHLLPDGQEPRIVDGKASANKSPVTLKKLSDQHTSNVIDDDKPMSLRDWLKQLQDEERKGGSDAAPTDSPIQVDDEPELASREKPLEASEAERASAMPTAPNDVPPSKVEQIAGNAPPGMLEGSRDLVSVSDVVEQFAGLNERLSGLESGLQQSFDEVVKDMASKRDVEHLATFITKIGESRGLTEGDLEAIESQLSDVRVFVSAKITNFLQETHALMSDAQKDIQLVMEEAQKTRRSVDSIESKMRNALEKMNVPPEFKCTGGASSIRGWLLFAVLQIFGIVAWTTIKKKTRANRKKLF